MLEIRNLGVRYGHHLALEGVSAKVDKAEICVILGANGAGKSSLLKAVAGMVKSEAGSEVNMNGKPITGMKPHLIVEQGIALVPEGRGIFGDLTVAENLQLGAFARRARNQEAATLKTIFELFPRLSERKAQIVRTMSGGEQQMVAIGRALMSKPEILMLDEPSLGLSPLLSKDLFKSLKAIAATGVGILLVEQNAKQSLKIADRGYLIENGLITGENTAAALAEDPAVVNAYLGGATETRKTASRKIRLPAPFALPSTLEAMGRFMGELASRAGAIHAAFIRFMRREADTPSAFVGRYDPRAAGDPWDHLGADTATTIQRSRQMVSSDARNLSAEASRLARSASERLSRHVRSARLSGPRPSAFAASRPEPETEPAPRMQPASQAVKPPPAASAPDRLDTADLARRAGQRFAEHIRSRRRANPAMITAYARPFATDATQSPARSQAPADAARETQTPAAMLGHNSAGFDIDDEDEGRQAETGQESKALDYGALVARAASIQAAHLAARRKTLVVHSFSAMKSGDNSDQTARKG